MKGQMIAIERLRRHQPRRSAAFNSKGSRRAHRRAARYCHVGAAKLRNSERRICHRERPMQSPPLDPDVADLAPAEPMLTPYDHEHAITYMRMLDADAEGADWREVSRIVLHIDPDHDVQRARRAFDSHLARAKWMTREGYRHLLRSG